MSYKYIRIMIVTLSMVFRVSSVFLYTVTSFINLFPYSCNVSTSVLFVFVCFCMFMVITIFRKEHQNKKRSQKRRLSNGCPQMFSQPNNPNCPVKMLKTYLNYMPEDIKNQPKNRILAS